MRKWWKEAVFYQVYPRSFFDSNGDGIGDIPGLIEKLPYIKSLGVDAVWLNPVYKSPNDDGGYDISDYRNIQAEFGTLADFDRLVKEMHTVGLRLVIDMVMNHSSDEHEWFLRSRASKSNPYRNYYFWRPGKNGGPPNNWKSFFGGSAWQFDERTAEYYLHLFSRKQPDLNWESPELRGELFDIMRFWLARGVDGFRLDVLSCISKKTHFPDTHTEDFNLTIAMYYANGPRLAEFIRELRREVLTSPEVMAIGEGPGLTRENALDYLTEGVGLDMIFHFGHMFIDQGQGGRFDPVPWNVRDFKRIFMEWDETFADRGWGSVFLGNHDFPRMVSRWGNDQEYRVESSKLLLMLLLTLRGTPFIYQGDELGMTSYLLTSLDKAKDIETRNGWQSAKGRGTTAVEFLGIANRMGRDTCRSPMQWSGERNAGFTWGSPWMPVNPNHVSVNAQEQNGRRGSVLNFFRALTAFRKSRPVLVYGSTTWLEEPPEALFAYVRELGQEKLAVALNLSDNPVNLPASFRQHKVLLSSYGSIQATLGPWEGRIIDLTHE